MPRPLNPAFYPTKVTMKNSFNDNPKFPCSTTSHSWYNHSSEVTDDFEILPHQEVPMLCESCDHAQLKLNTMHNQC